VASHNRITLIGHLGRDPEVRYTAGGEAVAVFSIATTDTWRDKEGNKQERTDWHRIEFFGRQAEVCGQYLKKGSLIYVEGRMQYDKWTDKQGVERTLAKVRGESMQMLGTNGQRSAGEPADSRRPAGAAAQAAGTPPAADGSSTAPVGKPRRMDDFDDDIPF